MSSKENKTTDSLLVSSELADTRLDRLLVHSYPDHSRSYFQWLIREGCVLVNGKQVKKQERPKKGDEISITFRLTPEIDLQPEEIALDILYEDDHILAINKRAGMVVHPAPGHHSGTFVNALLHHCKNLPTLLGELRPGIVHRIDKDTSGVLLAAKTHDAHMALVKLFSERKIDKRYLAITIGNPGDVTIDAPIKRHPQKRKEMAINPKGRNATSIVKTLQFEEPLALAEIQIITGRTHQIRLHLKYHNTPVLGDPTYGSNSMNKKFDVHRQLLHAHSIAFIHPISGEPLKITAPLPQDFLAQYGNFQVQF